MPETSLSTVVNPHFLNKVMNLAELMDVVASDNIIDADGALLIAKGSKLCREHEQTLLNSKLNKAFERCVRVQAEGGIDSKRIVSTASDMIDTCVPLARILHGGGNGISPLAVLAQMEFGDATSLMLTIMDKDGSDAFEHSVMVSLLSVCMARKLRLNEADQMVAALAGLLHDVGELYVDPAYLAHGRRLQPHQWAHMVAHPRIGQILINELESFPLSVGRAVAEHHERFDGSGYPLQRKGNHISAAGQAVSVAEVIAGIMHKDNPLERAELALKIIPGEHARDLLSAVSGVLRLQDATEDTGDMGLHEGEGVERLFWRISSTLETGNNLLDGPTAKSPRTRELLAQVIERITTIQRAFISTGLDIYLSHNHDMAHDASGSILFEKAVATREIQWRLRDIARELALHSATPDQKSIFAPLIHLLDDDSTSELKLVRKPARPEPPRALAPTSFAGSQPYAA